MGQVLSFEDPRKFPTRSDNLLQFPSVFEGNWVLILSLVKLFKMAVILKKATRDEEQESNKGFLLHN